MKKSAVKKALAIIISAVLVVGASVGTTIITNKKDKPVSATIKNGLSAYEIAVQYGYEGTVEEWLESLNGKSAYEIAKENGYTGTETEWTTSLKATAGKDGVGIKTAAFSDKNELLITLTDGTVLNLGVAGGLNGEDGKDGANGKDGVGITSANINAEGQLVLSFSNGKTVNLDKVVGMNGTDGIGISSTTINTDGELVITYTNSHTANLGVVIGAKGDKGETGATGATGDKGDKGDQGEQGIQGDKGDKGDKGDQGEQGIQGIQGIQGVQGETGAAGQDGDDGVGIETIVIENGNLKITLTNETTLDLGNIKGEKGDKGETGATGATGATGDKGDQGEQGIQGEKGDKGDKGDQGEDGEDGVGVSSVELINNELVITLSNTTVINLGNVKGDKGDTGEKGEKGDKGDKGDTGAQGIQGIQGIQGEKGETGATGAAGEDGVSVTNVTLTADGELSMTFSTGNTVNLGNVKGKDGKDGVGVDRVKIENNILMIKYSNADAFVELGNVKGEKGDPGEKGETGAQGLQGPKGEDGNNGVDGKSAYELYKQAHPEYTGTLEEWLNSLKGTDGRGILRTEITGTYFIVHYTDGTSETHDLSGLFGDPNDRAILVYSKLSDGTYGVMAGAMAKYEANIVIPATYNGIAVTQILTEGFCDLTSLQTVVIPEGITTIGRKAFYGCIGLNGIELPNTLTTIEQYAFYNTANLSSVAFPESLRKIGAYAFYKSGLSSATLYFPSNWHTAAEYTVTGSRDDEFTSTIPSGTLDFKDNGKYYESWGSGSQTWYSNITCDISNPSTVAIALIGNWSGTATIRSSLEGEYTVNVTAQYYGADWNFAE